MINIINGSYGGITKTIQGDNFIFQDGKLEIYALGKLSTEQLNEKVAGRFQALLKERLDLDAVVHFKNNVDLYNEKENA